MARGAARAPSVARATPIAPASAASASARSQPANAEQTQLAAMGKLFNVATDSAFRGTLFAINSEIAPTAATKTSAGALRVRPKRSSAPTVSVWRAQSYATAAGIAQTAPTSSTVIIIIIFHISFCRPPTAAALIQAKADRRIRPGRWAAPARRRPSRLTSCVQRKRSPARAASVCRATFSATEFKTARTEATSASICASAGTTTTTTSKSKEINNNKARAAR